MKPPLLASFEMGVAIMAIENEWSPYMTFDAAVVAFAV